MKVKLTVMHAFRVYKIILELIIKYFWTWTLQRTEPFLECKVSTMRYVYLIFAVVFLHLNTNHFKK